MKRIVIRLMGLPAVHTDGKPVAFKYQKAEAIFYYIAVNRSVERSRVMGIFWPEEPEDKARKNLRNALYSIRQAFDAEVIANVGQRLLCFSDQVLVETDCDFLRAPGACAGEGEFLEAFVLKETPDFDDWVAQIREEIRTERLKQLHQSFRAALTGAGDPEPSGKEILRLDPFDEEICRSLMRHYVGIGQPGKCFDLYSRFCAMLEEELSLEPEPETVRLFQEVLEDRKIRPGSAGTGRAFFFGRAAELDRMEGFMGQRREAGRPGMVLVAGEAGVGKSTLIRRFLEQALHQDVFRIVITCHEGDEQHFLKTWYPVVLRIGEILSERGLHPGAYQREILSRVFPMFMNTVPSGQSFPMEKQGQIPLPVIIRMVVDTLTLAVEARPLILTIEDLQWMDPWSLELLKGILLDMDSGRLLCIGSLRSSLQEELDRFSSELERQEALLPVRLERFTPDETDLFIREYPGRPTLDPESRRALYAESEGNPLILTEILKSIIEKGSYDAIPVKVRTLFAARCQSLSAEARKLADLLAVFTEPAGWEDIRGLNNLPDLELLEVLEELLRGEFLMETDRMGAEVRYQFSHQKLKEFVYNSQSSAKRKLLHKRIAEHYRERLRNAPGDRLLYPMLVLHYERAGERSLHLEYRIRSLYDYLEISHELFPRIRDREVLSLQRGSGFSEDYIVREIKAIDRMMESLPREDTAGRLELEYLNMAGRYQIVQGDVATGRSLTLEMIARAEAAGNRDFILKGYLQLIFNAINQRDIPEMERLLQSAFHQVRAGSHKGETGVLIRLKGYLMILKNRFDQGEALLTNAVGIFNRPEYREAYALNHVAAMYYLGESRRLQNDYAGALHWYREAEGLCRDQGFSSHLALILSSIGIAAYDGGRFEQAEGYLRQSAELYDSLQFKWGQVSAYAYWALLNLRQGQGQECLKYLRKADRLTQAIDHAYETGLMLRIKAEICCLLKTLGGSRALSDYLGLPAVSYCREAIGFFNIHPSFTYEKKVLSDLNRICGQCRFYQ